MATKTPPTWRRTKSLIFQQAEPLKTFTYEPQQLFDKVDTAKPKNQKSLRAAGQFLADNEFGVAVVVVSTSMAGDTEKDLVLDTGSGPGRPRLPREQFRLR